MKAHKSRLAAGDRGGGPTKRQLSSDPPRLKFPPCAECGASSTLVGGEVIYPHRRDLWARKFWRCLACGAYVGTHRGGSGEEALGRPAGAELRRARGKVHELIDPLWIHAERMACYAQPFDGNPYTVRSSQRVRVYAFLRVHLKCSAWEVHTGWMDIEQCRAAWRVLSKLRPEHVRDWWKAGGEREYYALLDADA